MLSSYNLFLCFFNQPPIGEFRSILFSLDSMWWSAFPVLTYIVLRTTWVPGKMEWGLSRQALIEDQSLTSGLFYIESICPQSKIHLFPSTKIIFGQRANQVRLWSSYAIRLHFRTCQGKLLQHCELKRSNTNWSMTCYTTSPLTWSTQGLHVTAPFSVKFVTGARVKTKLKVYIMY